MSTLDDSDCPKCGQNWWEEGSHGGLTLCGNCGWDTDAEGYKDPPIKRGSETEQRLWAILIPGPDDVWAMPNEAAAFEAIAKHNAAVDSASFPPDIPKSACYASVIEWPFDAQSHADALENDEPETLSSNELGIPDAVVELLNVEREHVTDGSPCWCEPETDYTDPETGASVIVHRRPQ